MTTSSGLAVGRPAAVRPSPAAQPLPALRSARLFDRLRERIRLLHYSRRTEEAYVYWCRGFIRFHGPRGDGEAGDRGLPRLACE